MVNIKSSSKQARPTFMIDKNLQRFIDDIQSDFFDSDTNLEDSGT